MNNNQDVNSFAGKVARHLMFLYPGTFSESLVNRILDLTAGQGVPGSLWDETDVVLITYGNSIASPGEKPLFTLHRFLKSNLNLTFSCVHILPFFPSTSDDGFAVSDYMAVAPELGGWEDIAGIGTDFTLMFDLVLNHVSAGHPWFRNFLTGKSPGKDYFMEMDPSADYSMVVRPRSTSLFTPFNTNLGIKRIWTTFSADQVDLNFSNPEVLIEMIRILVFYVKRNVRIIRLDAIAFLWKQNNSSCLHLPQTHRVVRLLRDIAEYVNPRVIILTETNVPNFENWSYFGRNDEAHMVYQFTLPPLILYTLFTGNADFLTTWAEKIPSTGMNKTFLNFTASHDGIGIRPLEGILPQKEIQTLLMGIKSFGGHVSEKRNPDGSSGPYELNITYPDALKGTINGPDDSREKRFLCSQTIMLALQGIPAVYIHSLLGTANDYEGMKKTGQPRSINRKSYDEHELTDLLSGNTPNQRIFAEYSRIIKIRRQIKAFHPDCPQQIIRLGDSIFAFARIIPGTGEKIFCISNITGQPVSLSGEQFMVNSTTDVLSGEIHPVHGEIIFEPYQTRWLVTS